MRRVKPRGVAIALATVTLAIVSSAGSNLGAIALANHTPVAHAQNRQVLEGAPTPILLTGSDADGDPLTFNVVDGPSHGTLSGAAPTVVYTPEAGYNGPDSFTFDATDSQNTSNVATITLTVVPALWTSTGLYGGAVELLRTDPQLPDVVYAGTTSGLFKSTDGGTTWSATGSGLPHSPIGALAIDPSATSTLYAGVNGAGMYKSVDGGASWVALPLIVFPVTVEQLAVDPTNSSIVYAVFGGVLSPSSVYRSVDGGVTWSGPVTTGVVSTSALVIDPVTPTTLYVASGNGIAKSTDSGNNWAVVNDGLSNANILGLALDPTAPMTLFASSNASVFKSTNGGASWDQTTAPVGGRLAMDESSPSTLYLGTLSSGVYKTIDGGDTWQPANAGMTSATIYAIAVGGAPASIYASPGQIDVGVLKSADGATTWTSCGLTGLANAAAAGLAVQPGTALIASGNGRILKRSYIGGVWTNVNATPPIPSTLLADPNDPSTFYGVPGSGGVAKSIDGAVTWMAASTGLPSGPTSGIATLAIDPTASGTLYAGTSGALFSSGTIYKTIDGGNSWNPSGTGLPTSTILNPLTIDSIVVDPATPTRVYAAAYSFGVFVSTDGGASWSQANNASLDPSVRVLAIDPVVPTTIYAGTDSGVYRSLDRGVSWTGGGGGLTDVNIIAIDPGNAGLMYAATQQGVYRSLNGGLTWIAISAGLFNPVLWTMQIDPVTHAVFAATQNGVFELHQVPWTTPAVTWTTPAEITYGTPLGSAQLDATAEIPGTFAYTPAAGTVLDVGNTQTLSVNFSPTDAAHYANGTASVSINVRPANSTTTLYAFPTNASFLQPVYLIAVVAPVAPAAGVVGGTVEFMDGGTSLGTATLTSSGYAVLAANGLASGTHIVTASYDGSSRYNASASDPVGVSVDGLAESTFTLLVPVTNPQAAGQQTVLVAVVVALDGTAVPSGTVQFIDGNTVIGSASIGSNGLAIFSTSSLAAGPHLVGARYLGNGTFTASTAPPTVQTIYSGVRPAATTTTLGLSSPSSTAGDPVTITATVTSEGAAPTGPVIFFGDGLLLGVAPVVNAGGTFVGKLVLSNLPVGIHVITASYIGGAGTAASNSLPGVHVVQTPTVATASSGRQSGTTAWQLISRAVQLAKARTAKR